MCSAVRLTLRLRSPRVTLMMSTSHSLGDLAACDEAALQWDEPSPPFSTGRTAPPRRRSSLSRFYAAKSQSFSCMSDLQANPFSQSTAIVLAKKRGLANVFCSGEELAYDAHERQAAPKRRAAAAPLPAAAADSTPPSLARHSWDSSSQGTAATHAGALPATSGDDDSDDDQEASGPGLAMDTARPMAMMMRLARGHTSDSDGSHVAASAGASCWQLEPCGSTTAAALPAVACDGLCVALRTAALASSGPRQPLCFVEP